MHHIMHGQSLSQGSYLLLRLVDTQEQVGLHVEPRGPVGEGLIPQQPKSMVACLAEAVEGEISWVEGKKGIVRGVREDVHA